MTTYNSSLYGANPSDSTNIIYRGPSPKATGEICVRRCTFTGVMSAATTDKLNLFDAITGERIIGFYNNRSGDPDVANDFTCNIGFISAPTGIAAASTGMQAAVAMKFDAGDLIGLAPAVKGDKLQVAAVAGAAEVSVEHRFTILSHVSN